MAAHDLDFACAQLADEPHPDLLTFTRRHWPTIEPEAKFVTGDCARLMCEFLQAWCEGQFERGILCVPPGLSKSTLTSVMLPAWDWSQRPGDRWLCTSFDQKLVLRDAEKFRSIIESEEYQNAYPKGARLRGGGRAMGELWTTKRGLRASTQVGGRLQTGWHFHRAIIDDPIKPQDVLDRKIDAAAIPKILTWHDKILPTRCALTGAVRTMLIMQRLLEHDLAGECLKREGFEALILPMRFEPKATWVRGGDFRTEPGQLLEPERFPEPLVRSLEVSLGDDAHAQLQQNPTPQSGGMVSAEWLRWEWVDLPYHGWWLQVWDLSGAGTDVQRHSAVHGALWCAHTTGRVRELLDTADKRKVNGKAESRLVNVPECERYHLVDEVWGVWPFEETLRQITSAQLRPHWHRAMTKYIEEKASGVQAIQVLQRGWRQADGSVLTVPGIVPTKPLDDKIARFRPLVPPAAQAGLILLPPWYPNEHVPGQLGERGPDAFRDELVKFPRGSRDDRCDTTSEAMRQFTDRSIGYADQIRRAAEAMRLADGGGWG